MEKIGSYIAAASVGLLLDWILGDPSNRHHPVCWIGWLIKALEKRIRKLFPGTQKGELAGGTFLAALVIFLTCFLAWLVLLLAKKAGFYVELAVMSLMDWTLLASKSLRTESMKVHDAMAEKDTEKARDAVSMIVGRDTKALTEEGIIKAAVETVAENTSDGVVAPLCYLMAGGPVLGFFYKAINTMDSMVGYKNDQYLYFGRAAARLDDLVNLLPARVTGILMTAAACLLHMDGKGAWNIYWRDRYCHKSPNSAHGEAACAGALGIRLAGDAWYFGKLYKKPTIGDAKRPVEYQDIERACRLMETTVCLTYVLCVLILLGIGWWFPF